ncbi:MAG TPA: alpha/beta hydrolase [Dehalococcoidia bacterium]|nr:alpha/beta hydrolase [Dehalococcoidia bacterium]
MPYAANPDDSVKIRYAVEGDGPPLLLHHGFMGRVENWRERGYADALSESYRLILMDARGHGWSGKPQFAEAYAMELRVSDVTAVLDAVGVEQVHFFGYSMGGHTGFGMLKHASERLASLIIGGMVPYASDPEPLNDHAHMLRSGMHALVDGMETQAGERLAEPFRSTLLGNDAVSLIASTLATRDTPGLEGSLANATMPSLLFAGDADPAHDLVRRAAGEMPNAKFVSLAGLDHLSAAERSDLVLPHVTQFLARAIAEGGA